MLLVVFSLVQLIIAVLDDLKLKVEGIWRDEDA